MSLSRVFRVKTFPLVASEHLLHVFSANANPLPAMQAMTWYFCWPGGMPAVLSCAEVLDAGYFVPRGAVVFG